MNIDAIPIIKERLTMQDVLARYGIDYKRRMPCPLHGGKDNNFEVKDRTWKCYSHCGGGDVISFVQKLFGLSFPDTLKRIDADFGLGVYGDHSFEDVRRAIFAQKAMQAKRDRAKREKESKDAEYWAAFDEWKRLDDNMRKYKPKTMDEELHPLFVESMQKIDYAKYVLERAEEQRDT